MATLTTALSTLGVAYLAAWLPTALGIAAPTWLAWALGVAVATGGALASGRHVGRRLEARLVKVAEEAEAQARRPAAHAVKPREGDRELARLYAALDALSRSLNALLERERSFARYASHELRTPVGALKVQLERVELGTATAADVLPAVARQTGRIEELIDALLALTRARDQGSRAQALRPVLEESVETLEATDQERVYVIEPVPNVVVRESVLVRQALRNLVDNAVRHGAGPVTVRSEASEDMLTVRVRDMGSGIPGTVLRRLAEPAERRVAGADGHGLGLTLVALIARALDGRLHLHNTEAGLEASIALRVVLRRQDPA